MKIEKHLQLHIPNTKYVMGIYSENTKFMDIVYGVFFPYALMHEDKSLEDMQINLDFMSGEVGIVIGGICKLFVLEKGNEISQLCRVVQWLQRGLYPWGLYHGAAIHIDGETIVFLGSSGTGKTTLMAYLTNCHEDIIYLSEDVLVINCEDNSLVPYQRPLLLREGGKELLQKKYHVTLEHTSCIRYGNYSRYMIRSHSALEGVYPIKGYAKLIRSTEKNVFSINRITEDQEDIFLSNCYLPADVKNNVLCSMRLAQHAVVMEIRYSRLDVLEENLHNIIKMI